MVCADAFCVHIGCPYPFCLCSLLAARLEAEAEEARRLAHEAELERLRKEQEERDAQPVEEPLSAQQMLDNALELQASRVMCGLQGFSIEQDRMFLPSFLQAAKKARKCA